MATTPESISVNIVPNTPPPSTISPKVWASTIGTLVASLVMAVLAALINSPDDLAALLRAVPAWARFAIVATLPTLLTFVAGYVKRDTTRELGVAVRDRLSSGSPAPVVAETETPDGTASQFNVRAHERTEGTGPNTDWPLTTNSDTEYRGEHHAQ